MSDSDEKPPRAKKLKVESAEIKAETDSDSDRSPVRKVDNKPRMQQDFQNIFFLLLISIFVPDLHALM